MAFMLHVVPPHNHLLEFLQGNSLVAFTLVIRVAEFQEALRTQKVGPTYVGQPTCHLPVYEHTETGAWKIDPFIQVRRI